MFFTCFTIAEIPCVCYSRVQEEREEKRERQVLPVQPDPLAPRVLLEMMVPKAAL